MQATSDGSVQIFQFCEQSSSGATSSPIEALNSHLPIGYVLRSRPVFESPQRRAFKNDWVAPKRVALCLGFMAIQPGLI